MTTIYLMRHSKTLKVINTFNSDDLQIQNEKYSLSIEGEKLAEKVSNNSIFNDIDAIYSSNYVRAIQTAKYIAEKNDLEINIVSDLGERKFGINSWDELPVGFERKQFLDDDYKLANGESRREVRNRMYSAINKIIQDNKDKRIVVVSHGTAIAFLLMKWCETEIVNDNLSYTYNNKIIHDGFFYNCKTFKLEFDDNNNLVNIDIII